MELNKTELLLNKYFEGELTIAEENELRNYFSTSNVAPHLEQYKALFGYFAEAKKERTGNTVLSVYKKRKLAWLSIAATIIVLLGVGSFVYFNNNNPVKVNKELGTYNDPKEALKATQKALAMLSDNLNTGVEGVQYIELYEVTKNKIFVE